MGETITVTGLDDDGYIGIDYPETNASRRGYVLEYEMINSSNHIKLWCNLLFFILLTNFFLYSITDFPQ